MRNAQTAIDSLLAYQRQTEALEQVAELVNWDQETFMPRGASEQRAECNGVLQGVIHARKISGEFAELLENASGLEVDEFGTACLRRLRREHELASRVPEELPTAIARVSSRAMAAWQDARANEDPGQFFPLLDELVGLKRQEASALAADGNCYGALLDTYEEGATTEWLDGVFDRLRVGLVELKEQVLGSERVPKKLSGHFPESKQLELAAELASTFGFDWNRGRLDKSAHPFTSGSGNDVRITTRVSDGDPFNCLYSTIHETGHAAYEQNIREGYSLTPLGRGASFGVHESQSRLYENQIGRSRAFCTWLHARMKAAFGEFGIEDGEEFHACVNRVGPGYIRTDADEVQYDLHIMLRYSMERDLIDGRIEVADLEEAWNQRFREDFGFDVDKPSNGVLQDIHWSAGLFGYFPTYSIGNILAASLDRVMRRQIPDLDGMLSSGDLTAATDWLKSHVQQFGSLYQPRALMEKATGVSATEGPLLDYLNNKFSAIYGF